ncbi:MAG: hypothetical protein IPO58_12460 [Betaproteobacteria bacterium]|nr:hypothetical protein [Betaproteobacteria bacterium]
MHRGHALATGAPACFNEATLLSAMEGAGKLVDDEELRAAMAARGLGTPATRAAIIEGLLNEKYMYRDGRELVPTAKAFVDDGAFDRGPGRPRTVLAGTEPMHFRSTAGADGGWPAHARGVHGREIVQMTKHIVGQAKGFEERHDTRRLRQARCSLPQVRRRSA